MADLPRSANEEAASLIDTQRKSDDASEIDRTSVALSILPSPHDDNRMLPRPQLGSPVSPMESHPRDPYLMSGALQGSTATLAAASDSSWDLKAQTTTSKRRWPFFRLWLWESLGILLSIGCTLAVLTILGVMNGRPRSAWNAPIEINTAISVFSTIAQTSMLLAVAEGISQLKYVFFSQRAQRLSDIQSFDDASRGPWGSLVFLWKIRWHASVASIGAIITILALAMHSFTQQALGLPTRSVQLLDAGASVPMAKNFDSNRPLLPSDTDLFGNDTAELSETHIYDTGINDAVYAGLFAPYLQASHRCITGNCTWDFETLGICSQCKDVSAQVRVECKIGKEEPNVEGVGQLPRSQTCTYTTPSGLKASAWACMPPLENTAETVSPNASTIMNTSFLHEAYPWHPLLSVAFFNLPTELKSIPTSVGPEGTAHCELALPEVNECELKWCAKKYSSGFNNGIFYEHTVSSVPLVFGNQLIYSTEENRSCNIEQMGLTGCVTGAGNPGGQVVWTTPGFKPRDSPANWVANSPSDLENADKAFWINMADAYDIVNNLKNVLNARLDSHLLSSTNQFLSEKMWHVTRNNASLAMENMATSLTNAIREGPNSSTVQGIAYHDLVYVEFRWYWLILPVALVMLSTMFLAACMLFSVEQAMVWKSSLLPVLFHGLQGWSKEELSATSLEDMEEAARKMYALLGEESRDRIGLWRDR